MLVARPSDDNVERERLSERSARPELRKVGGIARAVRKLHRFYFNHFNE